MWSRMGTNSDLNASLCIRKRFILLKGIIFQNRKFFQIFTFQAFFGFLERS